MLKYVFYKIIFVSPQNKKIIFKISFSSLKTTALNIFRSLKVRFKIFITKIRIKT